MQARTGRCGVGGHDGPLSTLAEVTRPTLRELSALPSRPAALAESALVLIDCQNTYTRGVMELDGVSAALDEVATLLDRARTAGIPVIHVQHDGGAGSPYDLGDDIGAIVPLVAPRDGEPVVVKQYPDSFVQTDLDERLKAAGVSNLVLTGFMTHMCVNSTARGAFNLGYARPWLPAPPRRAACRAWTAPAACCGGPVGKPGGPVRSVCHRRSRRGEYH